MKCFYHNDMDGKCSAAIVYKYAHGQGQYIEMDYSKEFPIDAIEPREEVWIVDFHIPREDFDKLLKITPAVVWIDHHKSALEELQDIDIILTGNGIRQDGIAACRLTWDYCFPNETPPYIVLLLADYDVWKFEYGNETDKLQAGIKLYPTDPWSTYWETWLDSNYYPRVEISEGKIILAYIGNHYKSLDKFPIEFEGYKCIACNISRASSKVFDSVAEDYDMMITFYYDGRGWHYSLYTSREDIDVSSIALKYGGGGHRKAAGFNSDELITNWKY